MKNGEWIMEEYEYPVMNVYGKPLAMPQELRRIPEKAEEIQKAYQRRNGQKGEKTLCTGTSQN